MTSPPPQPLPDSLRDSLQSLPLPQLPPPPSPPLPPPSPPECFICTETLPLPGRSACACTNRYVHNQCLNKMLNSSVHLKCPVCAEPYQNVQLRFGIVGFTCNSTGGAFCGLVLCGIILLTCGIHTWVVISRRKMGSYTTVTITGAAALMMVTGIVSWAIVARLVLSRGPAELLESMLVKRKKVIISPAEIAMPELVTNS